MSEEETFRGLICRVRAGDAAAAAELVHLYEPEIRRAVRLRLTDHRLRRVVDSMDICQSVLGNFFVRVAAGQFDLDRPEDLIALLVTMARNKVRDHARRQHAERRDQRRVEAAGAEMLAAVADATDSPSQIVAGHELLKAVHGRLSDEERFLAEQRAAGCQWGEIAAQLGGSPEALRKKLTRALDRAAREIGLDELGNA
jgi:RNA polymerase sigma-70 factor (ECF subfamily)